MCASVFASVFLCVCVCVCLCICSWISGDFGPCPVAGWSVFTSLLLQVGWDSTMFPGHLLPAPTPEPSSNQSTSTSPVAKESRTLIGQQRQGPEKEG